MNKKKLSLEFKVGLFAIITIFLIFVFIFTQTKKSRWKGYEIGVTFDYVGGLDIGSPVRLSGVRVGDVKNIQILTEPKTKVLVTLRLNRNVKIGRNSIITIRTLGIIGEKYVEIIPSADKEYITKGEIVEGINPMSFEKFVSIGQDAILNLNSILSDLRKITSDVKTQKNIKEIIENTKIITNQVDLTLEKISNLSSSLDETNNQIKKAISKNSPKLEKLLENTNSLILTSKEEITKTLEKIREFTDTSRDLKQAIVKFEKTAETINLFFDNLQKEGLIADLMKEKDLLNQIKSEVSYLKDATLQMKSSAESFEKMTENINSILSYVDQGKGSIGKFVKSDELYNEVLDFIKDIKAHPWKLFIRRRE